MKVDCIVDLQFGSTGKGAVAAFMTSRRKYDASCRVQSIQAGHTVYFGDEPFKMRTIPCAWVDPRVDLVLGPGCFIDKELLLKEISMVEGAGLSVRDRLWIDRRAYYVTQADVDKEAADQLEAKVGSTAHGAGASLVRKLERKEAPTRVQDDGWAAENGLRTCDFNEKFQYADVLLEGCQGAMLAVHTSPYYPFVTARECTTSGILSEAGIPPRDVREVLGVFRTLPIRVGGNSGPADGNELTWEEVNRRAGGNVEPEKTTVTNRVRRIFEFSHGEFAHALRTCGPDRLFMTFANYLSPGVYGASKWEDMSVTGRTVVEKFIREVQTRHGVKVDWFNTGEKPLHFVEVSDLGR